MTGAECIGQDGGEDYGGMRRLRRAWAAILLLVLAAGMSVHSRCQTDGLLKRLDGAHRIGATYSTLSDSFYETINEEIDQQVRSNGDFLLVRDPEQSQERQNREIEELLEERIDLLIVNPVEDQAIMPALEAAHRKGVPVVLIDSRTDEDGMAACTITSNNYGAGLLDARHLISQTKSAKVVVLGNEDSLSCRDRLDGFLETLEKSGNDYRILANYDCGGQTERAMDGMRELLEQYPEIDVVMAVNDLSALGAMAALEEAGRLEGTLVYSVDGSPDAKTLVADGMMTATTGQSPLRIGQNTAEVVYEILNNKPYLTNIVVPVSQITKEDIPRFGTEGWQ